MFKYFIYFPLKFKSSFEAAHVTFPQNNKKAKALQDHCTHEWSESNMFHLHITDLIPEIIVPATALLLI